MKKIYAILLLLAIIFCNVLNAQTKYWHQTNGPQAGTVRNMTIDSSGNIFIFTSGSGIYKSSDNGTSWQLYNQGLPTLNMNNGAAAAIGYIYVYDQPGASASAGHLFRLYEKDVAPTWLDITPTLAPLLNYNDIKADPDGTVYLATAERGVLRSDDNGMTWAKKNFGMADTSSSAR